MQTSFKVALHASIPPEAVFTSQSTSYFNLECRLAGNFQEYLRVRVQNHRKRRKNANMTIVCKPESREKSGVHKLSIAENANTTVVFTKITSQKKKSPSCQQKSLNPSQTAPVPDSHYAIDLQKFASPSREKRISVFLLQSSLVCHTYSMHADSSLNMQSRPELERKLLNCATRNGCKFVPEQVAKTFDSLQLVNGEIWVK
jgi:hypothetical protein